MQKSWVYILTNKHNTTFYIGVTSNLEDRILEHKQSVKAQFTKKYNIKKLVYFEEYIDINHAIAREKQLKNWHKEWKLNLIKSLNPDLKEIEL